MMYINKERETFLDVDREREGRRELRKCPKK